MFEGLSLPSEVRGEYGDNGTQSRVSRTSYNSVESRYGGFIASRSGKTAHSRVTPLLPSLRALSELVFHLLLRANRQPPSPQGGSGDGEADKSEAAVRRSPRSTLLPPPLLPGLWEPKAANCFLRERLKGIVSGFTGAVGYRGSGSRHGGIPGSGAKTGAGSGGAEAVGSPAEGGEQWVVSAATAARSAEEVVVVSLRFNLRAILTGKEAVPVRWAHTHTHVRGSAGLCLCHNERSPDALAGQGRSTIPRAPVNQCVRALLDVMYDPPRSK